MIHELQQRVNLTNTAVLPYIEHINALLMRAVTVCKAAENSVSPIQKLPVKKLFHQGKESIYNGD